MDYADVYAKLIDRANHRDFQGYKEIHHIVPKCMGGGDEPFNLVALTAREHFIAHLLLVKIHPEKPSLIYAVKMMCRQSSGERANNRMYEWLRKREADVSSAMNTGSGNGFFGKNHSEETKQLLRELAANRGPRKWPVDRRTPVFSESRSDIAKRAAQTRIANGNHFRSEETKEKIRQTKADQPLEKKQGGKKNLGKKRSPELCAHFSKIRKGKPAHNKGKTISQESKDLIRDSNKSFPYSGSESCKFGCGQPAQYERKSGKGALICSPSSNSCPAVRAKRSRK